MVTLNVMYFSSSQELEITIKSLLLKSHDSVPGKQSNGPKREEDHSLNTVVKYIYELSLKLSSLKAYLGISVQNA